MTTPGGVPNLPQGALTIDNLESKTQDMTTPAMRSRAAERFPNIFNSSTGGNALNDLTPIGIITQIFSGFNSVVANADPADVQGPEDLPGMLLDFIESLPVVGELIGLLEAITGTYSGDDPVLLEVQTIFAPIRAIVDALTGLAGGTGGLTNFFPDLLGILGLGSAGLGTGSASVPGLGSIPLFGPLLNLFGGATTGTQATNFFTNLLSLLGGPTLTGSTGSFDPITTAENFITSVLNPTGLLASVEAIVQALTGQSGGSLSILGPLTGLFGPIIDLFDGLGSTTGASNFTDNGDGTGFFDLGSLGNLVDNGDGTAMSVAGVLENLMGLLGTQQATVNNQQNIIDSIFNALNLSSITGNQPDVITSALQNIPFLNILGIGGPANIGGSIQGGWDQLIGGFVGAIGSGAGLADLFNIGNQVSSNAALGLFSWNKLGILNNRPLDSGMLPTSKTNIPLSRVALQSTAPTFGVTQAASTTAWDVITQDQPIGVVRWHGSGNANLTGFYVNVWKMDRTTGVASLVHRSANIIGDIPATAATPPTISYVIPTPIAAVATECYGFELEPKGTGTHNVVGSPTWLPNDPVAFPRNFASTRNTGILGAPATIPSPTYATNVPVIEYGVTIGAVSLFHDPQVTPFSTAGAVTTPIPSWANHIDVIGVSAGGGGHQGGTFGVGGAGGSAGSWVSATWDRGTHFTGAATISITVGAGGAPNGGNGGNTTVTIPGYFVSAPGGAGATSLDILGSNHVGGSPGNLTYNSQPYVGGGTQNSYGAAGAAPGGAGAGGNWIAFQPGGAGAPGAVWIRAYQ